MGKFAITLTALMLAATPLAFGSASGGPMSGGADTGGMTSAPRMTPQQRAANSYNAGLNHKKKAQEYEQKAAATTDAKDRDKLLEKAKGQYEDAVDDYKKAIKIDPMQYQAMNEMGYAYRKAGNFKDSVDAYNQALKVKPDFAPAIEYRAEAYLGLSMFKEVQDAYLSLVRTNQDEAAALMKALESWQQSHQDEANPDVKAFNDWIVERKAVAMTTQTLSTNNVHAWN